MFQIPADFEPKLGHATRILHEIERSIYLIILQDEDPSNIQEQLNYCMVMLKVLLWHDYGYIESMTMCI